jgi:hypothetical protein
MAIPLFGACPSVQTPTWFGIHPYPDNGVALAAANAEIERGRATVAEQAVALHLHAGKARWD